MNETNTPETDSKIKSGMSSEEMMEIHVPASFARKLERERDEARAELANASESTVGSLSDWLNAQ